MFFLFFCIGFVKKNKGIKKIRKIFCLILLGILFIPTAVYLILSVDSVERRILQRFSHEAFMSLGADVSFDDVSFQFFNKVEFTNLCVYDQSKDTMLYVPELILRVDLIRLAGKKLNFGKIILNRADIRLRQNSSKILNSQFLLDALKSKDTISPSTKWNLSVRNIQLNQARFSLQLDTSQRHGPVKDLHQVDFSRLKVQDMTLQVSGLTPLDSGGVSFRILKLQLKERSGFELTYLSANVLINKNQILCRNLSVITPRTTLISPEFSLLFPSFKSFSRAFASEVQLLFNVPRSTVAFSDLGYFIPLFRPYAEVFSFSGRVEGTIDHLYAKQLEVSYANSSLFRADVELEGLPKIRSTMIYVDCRELTTTPNDLQRIQLPRSPTGHMILPGPLKHVTAFSYAGKFTGFFDNFVAYGTVTSNLGTLVTDLWIKPEVSAKTDTTFTFSGTIEARRFALGQFLEQSYLGNVSMKGRVKGSATRKGDVDAVVDGLVSSISLKGYEYKDVALNGAVKNQTYNGTLSVDDTNLKIDFLGMVDLSDSLPKLNFTALVDHARLSNLHLIDKDTSAYASFNMKGNFSGLNIDQLQGELSLKNLVYTRDGKTLKVNDLLLFTKNIDSLNRFIVRSEIVNAEVWGQYEFLKLPQSFVAMFKHFIPSLVSPLVSPDSLSHNNFKFELEFMDTNQLTNFLSDEFFIAEGSRMDGVYDPSHQNVSLILKIPYIDLSGKRWKNLVMNGRTVGNGFELEASCSDFGLNNRLPVENLKALAIARNDSLTVDIMWSATQEPDMNNGHLNALIRFVHDSLHQANKMLVSSAPNPERNTVVVDGNRWQFTHQGIEADSAGITVHNLLFQNDQQRISVTGKVSHNPEEKLTIGLQNLDLVSFSNILRIRKLDLGGVVNGEAVIADVFRQLYFLSDISVDGFNVNGMSLGNLSAKTQWNDENNQIDVHVLSRNEQRTIMQVDGHYGASDQLLDFDVQLDELPMAALQPFVAGVFSRFEGGVGGVLKIVGPAKQAVFDGSLHVNSLLLVPGFTKCEYRLSGTVPVVNNQLQIDRVNVLDRQNNQGTLSGVIRNNFFKDLLFNLTVSTRNNMELLNTTLRDNSVFYGNGFGFGTVRINGSLTNITLDMDLTTGRNSRIYIPLESAATVSGNKLITFVQITTPDRGIQKQNPFIKKTLLVDTKAQIKKLFTMNLTLNVTPDALTQLVFDPTIGDIMQGSGQGTLKFAYNSDGLFSMNGTFSVEQGKYESQFKSLLASKTFNIEKGGIITWDGNPLEAAIDVTAIYKARPPLSSLLRDPTATGNVDVDCILKVTNTLSKPDLGFDLSLPNARQEVRSYLSSVTSTDEEMMRQFSYLLAFNSFYSEAIGASQSQIGGMSDMNIGTMGLSSVSEFFSGQLSRMASQISSQVDIGVRYRPGTNLTGQDVELNVSTDVINFTGNVGVGNNGAATSNNSVLGDFSMDVRVTRDGRLRFKAFNRSNESYLFEQAPYTQGIGLLYRQEFNRIPELFPWNKNKLRNVVPADSSQLKNVIPVSEGQ